MKRRVWTGCLAVIGVLVLIFDTETSLNAAQEAMDLCIRTVIPSLFPFFVLIHLLSTSLAGLKMRWLSPLERLLHLPEGSGGMFLCGLLGGYPTGAQAICQSWRSGIIDRENAERMLAFSSNAGPAFIFGIVGPMFSDISAAFFIWGLHILSAILVGCVYPTVRRQSSVSLIPTDSSVSSAVQKSVVVMGSVCGWILLFRVIIAFCTRWFLWLFPHEVNVIVISMLELANGCTELHLIENELLRFFIASSAVNFGGLSVMMQTSSVTQGLRIGGYLKGKLLQTLFGILLSSFLLLPGYPKDRNMLGVVVAITSAFIFIALILWKKNNSSISIKTVV